MEREMSDNLLTDKKQLETVTRWLLSVLGTGNYLS